MLQPGPSSHPLGDTGGVGVGSVFAPMEKGGVQWLDPAGEDPTGGVSIPGAGAVAPVAAVAATPGPPPGPCGPRGGLPPTGEVGAQTPLSPHFDKMGPAFVAPAIVLMFSSPRASPYCFSRRQSADVALLVYEKKIASKPRWSFSTS